MIYKLAAIAFQRALNLKIIDFDDLHFSTDLIILDKLRSSTDTIISSCLQKYAQYSSHYTHGSEKNHNYHFVPWVKVEGKFYRLTSLDIEFA